MLKYCVRNWMSFSVIVASNYYVVNLIYQEQRGVKKENNKLVDNEGIVTLMYETECFILQTANALKKKWWRNIFSNVLSWQWWLIFDSNNIKMDWQLCHKMFRRETFRSIIKFQEERKRLGEPSHNWWKQ